MRKTSRKKYNRINKKRVFVLICLILLVIFEIVAFRNSRANKIIDITASIIDDEEKLATEEVGLEASNSGNSGYFVILPEFINNKRIDSYIVKEKEIHTQKKNENNIEKEKNEQVENNTVQENLQISNNIVAEKENVQENLQILDDIVAKEENENQNKSTEETVTENTEFTETTTIKVPGDTLYLTDEEVDAKQIDLRVVYSTFNKNDQILYDQIIQTEVDDNNDGTTDSTIKIEGFMPLDSVVQAQIVTIDQIEEPIANMLTDKISFKKAYDIKIIYNDKE